MSEAVTLVYIYTAVDVHVLSPLHTVYGKPRRTHAQQNTVVLSFHQYNTPSYLDKHITEICVSCVHV